MRDDIYSIDRHAAAVSPYSYSSDNGATFDPLVIGPPTMDSVTVSQDGEFAYYLGYSGSMWFIKRFNAGIDAPGFNPVIPYFSMNDYAAVLNSGFTGEAVVPHLLVTVNNFTVSRDILTIDKTTAAVNLVYSATYAPGVLPRFVYMGGGRVLLFYGTLVYSSLDNGLTWTASTPTGLNTFQDAVYFRNGVVLACGINVSLPATQIVRSTDYGQTWGPAVVSLPGFRIMRLTKTVNGLLFYAENNDPSVGMSANGGVNWSTVESGTLYEGILGVYTADTLVAAAINNPISDRNTTAGVPPWTPTGGTAPFGAYDYAIRPYNPDVTPVPDHFIWHY